VSSTVGRPVAGVEVELVDNSGSPVDVGAVGRVRLRSEAVMRGYWGGPPTGPGRHGLCLDGDATAAVLDDEGGLTTGDLGFLDDGGNLHLVGRATDLYIRGGYNVYPAEVEGVLGTHPRVQSAAVVGAPDPVLGEIGVAFVAPAGAVPDDGDRLLSELRGLVASELADYKAPDRLVVVDSLPLTPMMKVDKQALATAAAAAVADDAGFRGPARPPARSGNGAR
jgi:acyl-CoA synthetase (AMP-forming)/AMP-acid ligase II